MNLSVHDFQRYHTGSDVCSKGIDLRAVSSRCFREQGEHPTVGRNSTVCHITGFYFTYYNLTDCLRPNVWYALHTFFSIFQGNCFWHKYLDTFSYNFSIWLSFCMTKIPMSFFFFPNTCLIYWSIYFCYKTWHKFHRYLLLYYDFFFVVHLLLEEK